MKNISSTTFRFVRVVQLAVLVSVAVGGLAHGQQDAGCQVANAILGNLFKGVRPAPCAPGTPSGSPNPSAPPGANRNIGSPQGRIDTLENAEAVRSKLEQIYGLLGPDNVRRDASVGLDACMQAMAPFIRYENMMNSGYNELKARCTELQKPMHQNLQERFMQAENQRTSTRAEADRAEKQQEADRVATIVADLKAGKRQPTNCAEYMVTKGSDPATLTAPVMRVAYQAPQGIGMFRGNVERIDGGTIVLND